MSNLTTVVLRVVAITSAVGLCVASAGFGAVYAYRIGIQHNTLLAVLMVMMAVGLEGVKPLAIHSALQSITSFKFIRGSVLLALGLVAVAYSLSSELSLMSMSRGDLTASREHKVEQQRIERQRYQRLKSELDGLGASRPAAEIKADHPDYLASLDGATLNGRALEPVPFDAAVLGSNFSQVRPPLPEFMLLGGMMVDRTDISHLLAATRRLASLGHTIRLLTKYGWDRLYHKRGARLVMGNALVGRLYYGLLQHHVPVALSTEVEELIHVEGSVTGARLRIRGRRVAVRARGGVVLATGGISNDPELRHRLFPEQLGPATAVIDSATGDGLRLAEIAGGHLEAHNINSFWTPVSRRRRSDGSVAVFPHFVLDRGKPGMLAVDPNGRRFVNEATTYHLFGEALFATLAENPNGTCHLICDDTFITKYGAGMVRPRRLGLRAALRDGYLSASDNLEGLAAKIAVPADALVATIERHNRFADTGKDLEFGKGEDAYQRNLGDPSHRPNPCIGRITQPPFYALAIHPGDIGATAGLACDRHARVVRPDGTPITGLYACGNDMASIMAECYPGPGITLGPAMTFGYLAARHAHDALNKCKNHGNEK